MSLKEKLCKQKTVYSVTNFIDVAKKKMNLELHFDRFRDVHITVHGIINMTLLDAGLDLKWDANRDPSQKLIVILNSKSYGKINHDGKCIIEYPGKIITAVYFLQHKFTDYIFSLKVDWSPKDVFDAYFHVIYDIPDSGLAEFRGKVDTPFKNWEQVALSYKMKLENQSLTSNGSVTWQKNQRADVEVSYFYNISPDDTHVIFISTLNSTIPEVNSMKGILRHRQKKKEFASELIFQVRRKIEVSGQWKKYTTSVKGYMKIITESQLLFQIETPFDKYKAITGKLMFSATNKTFFADLKSCISCISPASLGAEVIYIYHNTSNFNLKVGLHSSISFVRRLLIVGKRNPSTVDARFVWNNVVLGLIGRSHYKSWKDLEYALQLFTPIEGYNKASMIAKLMLEGRIDFEASLNVAEKKVGLKIQSMFHPEENFAVPDFDSDPPRKNKNSTEDHLPVPQITQEDLYFGTVYWRGFCQLDTPMYPTVYGLVRILEDDENEYNTIAFFSFPFGQLRLEDDLSFVDFMNIKNNLAVQTSCYCIELVNCYMAVSGNHGNQFKTELNAQATLNSVFYEVISMGSYSFTPNTEDSGKEGIYHLTTLFKSPLKMLNYLYLDSHIFVESPMYIGNTTIIHNNSSFKLDGVVETDDSYFDATVGAKINSSLLGLPDCSVRLFKDFTDFEKKIIVVVALPNEKGDDLVHYGIEGLYHYDPPTYLKTDLEIITPYSNIGIIKASAQYTYDPKNVHYFLETFLRYSKQTEVRASCHILTDTVSFSVDSTYDRFKKININGTLKNNAGVKTLQAVMSSDKEFKLMGWATVIPNRPLMVEVKLYKTATNEEILGIILSAMKNNSSYSVDALILKAGRKIHILCDYTPMSEWGRKVDIVVHTTYPKFESLNASAVLLNEGYSLMVYKIKGNVKSKWISTSVNINGDLSFQDNGGVSHIHVQSPQLSFQSQIMWMMEKFENVFLDIKGDGAYGEIRKELSAHLHFWNLNNEFQKMAFSTDINFNVKDWWLCANATLLWPIWRDLKFLSYVILPNKTEEVHTIMAHMLYKKDFSYGAHLLKYFRHPQQFDFATMSEFAVTDTNTKGAFLVKTKQHRIHDKFNLDIINKEYYLHNVLESTNMKEILTIDMSYKRPKNRLIRMDIYYPHPTKVVEAHVDFEALNNFLANMNCSTPFRAFPYIQVVIKAVSTRTYYVRLAEAKWTNNSATFNYTHTSNYDNQFQFTEGSVLVDFPLATRHSGLLKYTYESSDTKATGRSSLSYNNESLMSGNYTRSSEFSAKTSKDNIAIHVNNNFLPAGIIYNHRLSKKYADREIPYTDIKQLEFSKLTDEEENYHFTGEYKVDQTERNQLVALQGKYGEREAIICKFTEGEERFISSANITFHPDVWFGSGINIHHKKFGKEVEFNISYPRRNFAIVTDYLWNSSAITTELTVHPNKFKEAMSVTGIARWFQVEGSDQNKIEMIIGYPTFEKNVTLVVNYDEHDDVLLVFNTTLEYSMDSHKKLSINGSVINKSIDPNVLYEFEVLAIHPASRLRITEFGYLQIKNQIFEIDSNVTYKRSYFPLMFSYTNFKIDIKEKFFEIEKKSLRDVSFLKGKYGKKGSKHYINSTLRSGQDIRIASDFFVDFDNTETELVMNFTPDSSEKLLMKAGTGITDRQFLMFGELMKILK
ncbi:hypothetical protein GE061_000653 [Apolygus lucorum]|uniref:VWFD domain-containing protein n=1 Tax=Apolygus lucorum TaxID=248454 RepID=A0A8S9Y4W4_APOLU|nr:hypothetical protein GE061_000653 [Apolygus lucorum]